MRYINWTLILIQSKQLIFPIKRWNLLRIMQSFLLLNWPKNGALIVLLKDQNGIAISSLKILLHCSKLNGAKQLKSKKEESLIGHPYEIMCAAMACVILILWPLHQPLPF